MKRDAEMDFTFAGRSAREMGLRLKRLPARGMAARRGESVSVPGRDGALWLDGGARTSLLVEAECETLHGFDEAAAREWLSQEGKLIFSDEPERAWRAQMTQEMRFSQALEGYARKFCRIPFSCGPYRYHEPETGEILLLSTGSITNPGTASAAPKITVSATDDFTLTVSGCLIECTGGTIIIDSELCDCLEADGATLANGRAALTEFPLLSPGANAISWTGSVTTVQIEPRWRDI